LVERKRVRQELRKRLETMKLEKLEVSISLKTQIF
jgi:hypothetical protein